MACENYNLCTNHNYRATKLASSRCEFPLIIMMSVDVAISMVFNTFWAPLDEYSEFPNCSSQSKTRALYRPKILQTFDVRYTYKIIIWTSRFDRFEKKKNLISLILFFISTIGYQRRCILIICNTAIAGRMHLLNARCYTNNNNCKVHYSAFVYC